MGEGLSELLKRIERLSNEEKEVLKYFINNVSVGDIRAVLDLKAKGIEKPERIIVKLLDEGLLERGEGCYNLARPLRSLTIRKKIYI